MSDEYRARTEKITVVEGVTVDIAVSGDGKRAEKVLMDLKDRLGWIGAAFDAETPPEHLTERPDDKTPPMTVNWEQVFNYDPDE